MLKTSVTKFRNHIFSEHKRPLLTFILLGVGAAAIIAIIIAFIIGIISEPEKTNSGPVSFSEDVGRPKTGTEFDPAYRKAIEEQNLEDYQAARAKNGGMSIPFVLDDVEGSGTPETFGACGCEPMSDQQFREMLSRNGVDFDGKSSMVRQVGQSDVYVDENRFLVNEDATGRYQLLQGDTRIGLNGILEREDGGAIKLENGKSVFLSTDGSFIDKDNKNIALQGALLTQEGYLILGNGLLANKPGNMKRVANTDVYITKEGQLATVDSKPIRHAGSFVYRNIERELINLNRIAIRWENSSVLQNSNGYLTNPKGEVFKSEGILFSYDGIMIDNLGKLSSPLLTIDRLGNSDLFLDEALNLKDRFGVTVSHYGEQVTVTIGDALRSNGTNLLNHKGAPVSINKEGLLQVEVGKGGVQTGLLKNSLGVAYDRFGHLISRAGKLTQRGLSDIFHTSDGLLSTENGKPVKYKQKDIFFDYNLFRSNGLIGLRTYDFLPVVDVYGNRVYLSESGQFVDENSKAVKLGLSLTSADGVVFRQDGSLPSSSENALVLSADGSPLLHKGKAVYRTADGRLVYADNSPVLDKNSASLYLSDSGVITTENGNPATLDGFSTKSGEVTNSTFGVAKQVLGADGTPLKIGGRAVYEQNGKLIYENGEPVLDPLNSPLHIDPQTGLVMNDKNQPFAEANRKLGLGIHGAAVPLTKNGKSVFVNGKRAFVRADGTLVDASGNQIKTKDGRAVYYDSEKGIIDNNGNAINELKLTTADVKAVTTSELDKLNKLALKQLSKNGQPLFYNGKPVYQRADGTLVDANNNPILDATGKKLHLSSKGELLNEDNQVVDLPIFTDANGNYTGNTGLSAGFDDDSLNNVLRSVTKDGKQLYYNGKPVYQRADGTLVDENNNIVTTPDGKTVKINSKGQLVDGAGELLSSPLLTDSNGNKVLNNSLDIPSRTDLLTQGNVPLSINGEQAYVHQPDGTLMDSYKRVIKGKDGKALRLTQDGKVIDSSGNQVALSNNQKPLTANTGFKSERAGKFGAFTLQDGYVLGEDGKPITYKGQNVIRKDDGFLYTEDGKRILTEDGRPVMLSDSGHFVDAKGEVIEDALFMSGDGTLLYGDGEPVTTKMKQIGDSDIYLTKDGHLVGLNGKPYMQNGKSLKIDRKTGHLIDEDNKAVRDAKGNHVMISESGKLINRNGDLASSLNITDKSGELLTASGIRASRLHNLKAIEGSNKFTTPDMAIVDAKGIPLLSNGELVYADEKGRLLNSKRQRLRYHGQSIELDPDGYLVDSKKDRIEINGKPVKLSDIGLLDANQSAQESQPSSVELLASPFVEAKEASEPTEPAVETQPTAEATAQDVQSQATSDTTKPLVDLTSSTLKEKERLAKRFNLILQKFSKELTTIETAVDPSYVSESEYVELPELKNTGKGLGKPSDSSKAGEVQENTEPNKGKEYIAGAGDNLYAVTSQEMNTDFNDELEVKIVSGKRGSRTYLAVAYAKPVLKYDNVVLSFNRICPVNEPCQPFSGIGLDPVTGSAGTAADIDTHFWYRYGGLFLAQFGSGISEGISDSLDSETETTSDGTTTSTVRVISGLDYGEIAVKGLADTGDAFTPVLAERVNRPTTAYISQNQEIVIKLTQPLYL